ncbi:MAG: LysE family translocator [Pseudomonadota bacterium]
MLVLAWSIQLMGVVTPGPAVALILGVAVAQGRLKSLITAFGIACASIVLSVGTVLGLTAIFSQMAELMTLVRLIGAGYLTWLAYNSFRIAFAKPMQIDLKQQGSGNAWKTGLKGFFLQLSNPKAILFWLAVASVGGVGDAPVSIVVLFVVGAFINSFVGHGAYALLLSSTPARAAYSGFRGWIEATLGCFFLFAAFKLATEKS